MVQINTNFLYKFVGTLTVRTGVLRTPCGEVLGFFTFWGVPPQKVKKPA